MDEKLVDTMKQIETTLRGLKESEGKPVNFIVAVMVDCGDHHDISVKTDVWNDHHYLDLLRSILSAWNEANHIYRIYKE